jgi:hypothetical protein
MSAAMTARRPARAAAALACIAAVLAGPAVAGCGGPARAARVPATAVPRLTAVARRAARVNGDPAPAWAAAVLTTRAKALTSATPGDFVPGAAGSQVFLVTMLGRFTAYNSSPPAGAALPAGRYLSIVVDAGTFQVLDSGLSAKPPPVAPASLGPVTYLILPRHLTGSAASACNACNPPARPGHFS